MLATRATAVTDAIVPTMMVILILGKDLYTVLGFVIIYLVTSEVKIVPVAVGKITTALQLSMVLAILISPDITAHWPNFQFFVRFLWWMTSAMAILTMIVYTRNGTRFLNEFEQKQERKQIEK